MVTGERRHPTLPNVPTAAECGLQDFVVVSWQSFMGPGNMPVPLRDRVAGALRDALVQPEVRTRLEGIGFDVVANTPEEYSRFQQAEIARWREVVRAANVTAG